MPYNKLQHVHTIQRTTILCKQNTLYNNLEQICIFYIYVHKNDIRIK